LAEESEEQNRSYGKYYLWQEEVSKVLKTNLLGEEAPTQEKLQCKDRRKF